MHKVSKNGLIEEKSDNICLTHSYTDLVLMSQMKSPSLCVAENTLTASGHLVSELRRRPARKVSLKIREGRKIYYPKMRRNMGVLHHY